MILPHIKNENILKTPQLEKNIFLVSRQKISNWGARFPVLTDRTTQLLYHQKIMTIMAQQKRNVLFDERRLGTIGKVPTVYLINDHELHELTRIIHPVRYRFV